jgi:hypothetical protein
MMSKMKKKSVFLEENVENNKKLFNLLKIIFCKDLVSQPGTFGGPKFVLAQFWEVFINSSGS